MSDDSQLSILAQMVLYLFHIFTLIGMFAMDIDMGIDLI